MTGIAVAGLAASVIGYVQDFNQQRADTNNTTPQPFLTGFLDGLGQSISLVVGAISGAALVGSRIAARALPKDPHAVRHAVIGAASAATAGVVLAKLPAPSRT